MSDIDVDAINALAQFIRYINGNNSMGAAVLAENILEWQAAKSNGGAVPKGWKIERESEHRITLDADGLGFYVARLPTERIPEIMLYALANDLLLSAPQQPAQGQGVSDAETQTV